MNKKGSIIPRKRYYGEILYTGRYTRFLHYTLLTVSSRAHRGLASLINIYIYIHSTDVLFLVLIHVWSLGLDTFPLTTGRQDIDA